MHFEGRIVGFMRDPSPSLRGAVEAMHDFFVVLRIYMRMYMCKPSVHVWRERAF